MILDSAWGNAMADPGILAISGYARAAWCRARAGVANDPRLAAFHDGRAMGSPTWRPATCSSRTPRATSPATAGGAS